MSSVPVPPVTETSPPTSAALETLPAAAISDSLSPAATADRWVYGLVALVLALVGLGVEPGRSAAVSGSGIILGTAGSAGLDHTGADGTASGRPLRAVLTADLPVQTGAVLPLEGGGPAAALLPLTAVLPLAAGSRRPPVPEMLAVRPSRTGAHPPTGPPVLSRI